MVSEREGITSVSEQDEDDETASHSICKEIVNTLNQDSLPIEFRHMRDSERMVKENICNIIANLTAEGLSVNEAVKAVIHVANSLFGRQWKEYNVNCRFFDIDTMPHERKIID